ncbi:MAG: hypothetical protein ACTHOP_12620 [Mesorhizobium sp.]
MQARALYPWLLTLLLALSSSALGEEWQVTSGAGGDEHAIWTLKRSASNGLGGTGKITKADGSTESAIVIGNATQLMVTEQPSGHGCIYKVLKASGNEISGKRHCDGKDTAWTASIGKPTDMSLPVLLKAGEDPRSSTAFKSLSGPEKDKIEREAREFAANMQVESSFSEVRDMNCLADQYLGVRIQKFDWSGQDILHFIQDTCVVPELVHKHAARMCATVFPKKPKSRTATGNIPGFCDCFSDHFTTHFMASPYKNTQAGESEISGIAAGECRKGT